MKSEDANKSIVEGYVQLLDNLDTDTKLDLIAKLSTSVKSDINKKTSKLKSAFGAFSSDNSAKEIINEIRNSRTFTRQIEEL